MRCCDVERLWDEMRDALQPHRAAVIEHLRACPPCQELYEQYEGIAYCLTCLPPPEPPANLVPKIIDHIRSAVKATVPDSVAKMHSPLGPLFVAFRETGITYVALDRGEGDESAFQRIKARLGRSVVPSTAPAWVDETLNAFFRNHVSDLARVDISDLTPVRTSDPARDRQDPGRSGPQLRLGGRRNRTAQRGPRRGRRDGPQSGAAALPLPSGGRLRRPPP